MMFDFKNKAVQTDRSMQVLYSFRLTDDEAMALLSLGAKERRVCTVEVAEGIVRGVSVGKYPSELYDAELEPAVVEMLQSKGFDVSASE